MKKLLFTLCNGYFFITIFAALLFVGLVLSGSSIVPSGIAQSVLSYLVFYVYVTLPVNTFLLVALALLYRLSLYIHKVPKVTDAIKTGYHNFRTAIITYVVAVVPLFVFLLLEFTTGNSFALTQYVSLIALGIIYATFITLFVISRYVTKFVTFSRLATLGVLILSLVSVLSNGYILYEEFQPHFYGTFKLDDSNGVYIVNYDGDYWLTYYLMENVCTTSGKLECKNELVKKGNTSIIEAPVELDQFLKDQPVRVRGSFSAEYHPPGNRTICIQQRCRPSVGQGYWHSSPLKIKQIELAQ